MTPRDLTRYLGRLGLSDPGPPAPETLARLQEAHLRAVPFEAIDPFLGETPALDQPALLAKILDAGRGGYCFELNTAYGALLNATGFDARRVLARVRIRDPGAGPRNHLAWLVRTGDTLWLTDVGFGGPSPWHPIRVQPGVQDLRNGAFRLVPDTATGEDVLERREAGSWRPIYSFDRAHVTDGDIAAANHVTATWRGAPFSSNLMIGGYAGDLRVGLFNRAVSETRPDATTHRELAGEADLAALLATLRIDLPRDTISDLWHRLS